MTVLDHAVGGREMAIEDNFVPVLPTVLIDPVLKLRLEQGRWNPESSARGGAQDIHLSYDPEIRAGRLTMPIPPKRRELLEMLGPLKRDWTVFESENSKRIANIIVDIQDRPGEVRLEFKSTRADIHTMSELISRQEIKDISNRPYEILLYMFQSVIVMPDWAEKFCTPWRKSSISFCASSDIADELSTRTGARFEPCGTGLAKIADRQVRP